MLISVFNVRCWKSSFTPVSSVSLNNQTQILSVFLYGTFYFYVFICFICVMLFPLLEKLSQAAKAIYTIIYSPSIFSGEETSPIFPQARFFHISCIYEKYSSTGENKSPLGSLLMNSKASIYQSFSNYYHKRKCVCILCI